MQTPRKFIALRWLGIIATVIAWLALVLCVIALLYVLANVPDWARTLLVGLVLFWGVSTFLTYFVRGTVLLLLTDLEHQARASAQALDQMRSLLQSAKAEVAQPVPVKIEAPAETRSNLQDSDVTRIRSYPVPKQEDATPPAEPKKPETDSKSSAAST